LVPLDYGFQTPEGFPETRVFPLFGPTRVLKRGTFFRGVLFKPSFFREGYMGKLGGKFSPGEEFWKKFTRVWCPRVWGTPEDIEGIFIN